MGSGNDCCVGMAKFLAFLAFVTFLLHAAGMANPYWLKKDFSLLTSALPGAPLVEVESHIGLLWACNDQQSKALGIDKYKCESLNDIDEDLVEDWQWVSAGLAVGSALGTFLGLIMSSCIACKSGRNMGLRAAVVLSYFIACVLFVAVLVLMQVNKEILVFKGPIDIRQDYSLDWGYYVAAVGACMFFLMSVLHLFVACGTRRENVVV